MVLKTGIKPKILNPGVPSAQLVEETFEFDKNCVWNFFLSKLLPNFHQDSCGWASFPSNSMDISHDSAKCQSDWEISTFEYLPSLQHFLWDYYEFHPTEYKSRGETKHFRCLICKNIVCSYVPWRKWVYKGVDKITRNPRQKGNSGICNSLIINIISWMYKNAKWH